MKKDPNPYGYVCMVCNASGHFPTVEQAIAALSAHTHPVTFNSRYSWGITSPIGNIDLKHMQALINETIGKPNLKSLVINIEITTEEQA